MVRGSRDHRSPAYSVASDLLQYLNWLFLIVYAVASAGIFLRELMAESPFYPEPFRFFYGVFVVPAVVPLWLGFLIADLIREFRWPWLAASLACAALVFAGYHAISALTVVPG